MLVRKTLKVTEVVYGENSAELIAVKIDDGKVEKREFVVMYVPPKTRAWSNNEYNIMLEDTKGALMRVIENGNKTLIMGDFNCKEVCWEELYTEGSENTWGHNLLDMTVEYALTQWVHEKTRFRNNEEPSRLDLIFTKEPDIVNKLEYKTPIGKSDHVLLEVELKGNMSIERKEKHREGRLLYSKTDFTGIRKFFQEADWQRIYEGETTVEEKWKTLLDIYNKGVEKYVPRLKEKSKYIQDWFNNRCRVAKERRNRAWNKWRKRRNQRRWQDYINERNEYVKIRREERRNYERDVINTCRDKPKLFYRYVNGKLKSKHEIEKLYKDGIEYSEEQDLVEIMSEHFQTVYTRENEHIEAVPQTAPTQPMREFEVSQWELMKQLKDLDVRKSHGPDGVSNWILKECREELVSGLHHIIDCSLKEGKIPQDWKNANVVPIHKGGNKEEPTNYRPVSLTCTIVKICERIIKDKWTKYLEDNGILNQRQFGFRQGRSCTTNLLCYYSRIVDIIQERDGWADCAFLDLRKAFDKVPHKKLLRKLEIIGGIQGRLLDWMEDFLKERKMRVTIRGKHSSWKEVISGVPQGTVLAPVMFAVYVNDMDMNVDSYMSFFADDAKLLRRVRNVGDCQALQSDLDKLWEWSKRWEMDFNINKCSIMEFGKSKNRTIGHYKLGEEELKKVDCEKDLGVIITKELSPDKHISKIVGETYNLLRNIRMAFTYLDENMIKQILVTLIRPRLEYAAVFWSPSTKKNIKRIERIQRATTKLVPTLSGLSYEERLERLGLTTLERRRERGDLIAIYRLMKGMEVVDREDLLCWDTR